MKEKLTQERLRELLHYNPDSGVFTWRVSRGRVSAGSVAGCLQLDGYTHIRVSGKLHRAHRLIWLYVTGKWPADMIDHINGDRSDNRLSNLREATREENFRNCAIRCSNTSGVKGVSWNKYMNKWVARCREGGKYRHLGYFTEIAEAERMVKIFREQCHGEFANHG